MLKFNLFQYAIILFATLSVNISFSQKLDDKKIAISYKDFPSIHLPSSVKTYAIDLKGTYQSDSSVLRALPFYINLELLTLTRDKSSADLLIDINLGKLDVKKKEKKTFKEKVGNTETEKYFYEITYVMPVQLYVYKTDRSAFFKSNKIDYEEKVITTDAYYKEEDLIKSQNQKEIELQCKRDRYRWISSNTQVLLNPINKYIKWKFYSGSGKKLNYDNLDDALDVLKNLFKEDDIYANLNAGQTQKMESIVAMWKAAFDEADLDNPSARINKEIFNGLNFNLAFGLSWLGRFDEAWKHFDLIENLDSESVNDLNNWMAKRQSGWLLSHAEIDFSNLLIGEWFIKELKVNGALDLNKDGVSSSNLLTEFDQCKSVQKYTFGYGKKLSVAIGENGSCEKKDLYWKVSKSSRDDSRHLTYDDDIEYVGFDASDILKIVNISRQHFEVVGEIWVDKNSDSTNEVTIVFEKKI